MKNRHKFQRTRRGVVIPDDMYVDAMAEMHATMYDLSRIVGALKRDPSELNVRMMERAVFRSIKSMREIRVNMGSCPSSVWKVANWRKGSSRSCFMGWITSGVDGLVR